MVVDPNRFLLKHSRNSEEVIVQLIESIVEGGLQVTRSFDLQVARGAHTDCSCPHHGTSQCDCQMVVLLIYGEGTRPATLVAHSRDGWTQVSLIGTPELRVDSDLENAINRVLGDHQTSSQELCKHAT